MLRASLVPATPAAAYPLVLLLFFWRLVSGYAPTPTVLCGLPRFHPIPFSARCRACMWIAFALSAAAVQSTSERTRPRLDHTVHILPLADDPTAKRGAHDVMSDDSIWEHAVPSKPLSDWDSFDAQRFFLYLASSTGAAEFVRAAHAVVKQGIDGQALLKASSGLQLSRAAHQELLVELHMCIHRFPLHKPA